jgi:hypothetical protein
VRRLLCAPALLAWAALGAAPPHLVVSGPATVHPLETVTIASIEGARVQVRDGAGHVYWQAPGAAEVTFRAGGALGLHKFEALDASGRVTGTAEFTLAAESELSDRGGRFAALFKMARDTMLGAEGGEMGQIDWRGKTYRYFVPWILDHSHTTKGMQYFKPYAAGLVDLMAGAQRGDGMIWSFVAPDAPWHAYHYWAYQPYGYAKADGGVELRGCALLRLEGIGRRRLDGGAARRGPQGSRVQRDRPGPVFSAIPPSQARLHYRQLGLPAARQVPGPVPHGRRPDDRSGAHEVHHFLR